MDEIDREAARVFHEVQRTARGERDGVARERVRAVGPRTLPLQQRLGVNKMTCCIHPGE